MSFRFGGLDGVSVVADSWRRVLVELGHRVVTVAGAGTADRLIPGLAWPPSDDPSPPDPGEVTAALADADLVVVENLCSLPLLPSASAVVADALRGRPAVLHHYDLPWQRARFAGVEGWPPDDVAWAHVTINDHSRAELAAMGVEATTIRCGIDVDVAPGDRSAARSRAGIDDDERVLLHPVRAIARKDIPRAVALAEAVGATYWLTGPAEEGYDTTLAEVLGAARCRVVHQPVARIADAYAACDAVALPSTVEGFGNPLAESAVHRRPVAVGRYPAALELAELGFRWFDPDEPADLAHHLAHPEPEIHDHNRALVGEHLSLERVSADVADLLSTRWGA